MKRASINRERFEMFAPNASITVGAVPKFKKLRAPIHSIMLTTVDFGGIGATFSVVDYSHAGTPEEGALEEGWFVRWDADHKKGDLNWKVYYFTTGVA